VDALRRNDGGYEFSPGFRWATGIASALIVGTIVNGLYLWREHGVLVASDSGHHFSIAELKNDVADIKSECITNTINRVRNEAVIARLEQQVLELQSKQRGSQP
jgi:hypothetical protein